MIEDPMPWTKVIEHIKIIEGVELSRQRCQQIEQIAFKKLAAGLSDDPVFRDWANSVGWKLNESKTD